MAAERRLIERNVCDEDGTTHQMKWMVGETFQYTVCGLPIMYERPFIELNKKILVQDTTEGVTCLYCLAGTKWWT